MTTQRFLGTGHDDGQSTKTEVPDNPGCSWYQQAKSQTTGILRSSRKVPLRNGRMKLPGQDKWTSVLRSPSLSSGSGIFERNRKHILDAQETTQPQEEDDTPIPVGPPEGFVPGDRHRAYQFGGHSGEDNNQTGWYNRQTDNWWLPELVCTYYLYYVMLFYVSLFK